MRPGCRPSARAPGAVTLCSSPPKTAVAEDLPVRATYDDEHVETALGLEHDPASDCGTELLQAPGPAIPDITHHNRIAEDGQEGLRILDPR